MKLSVAPFTQSLVALTAILLSPSAFAQNSPAKGPVGPPPAGSVSSNAEPEIPQSVFTIPSNPNEGRNPFFPRSTVVVTQPKSQTPINLDTSSLVLNGITSPPKRTAMINGRTFEIGEENEVKLPNGGKERIKCLEIKDDSAIIEIRGL